MRYLVKARVLPGREKALTEAIDNGSLGRGSVAEGEYDWNMRQARLTEDGAAHWVETCFCAPPLEEERPYWEKYFELLSVKDAHNRKNCQHENGTKPWPCGNCDCTKRLDERLSTIGTSFLARLKERVGN